MQMDPVTLNMLVDTNQYLFPNYSTTILPNVTNGITNSTANIILCTNLPDANFSLNNISGYNISRYNSSYDDMCKKKTDCLKCDDMTWEHYVKLIFIPLFFVIGLFGNTISFIVMSSPIYRRKSYSYYLRALAVFDTITLLATLILEFNDLTFDLCLTRRGFLSGHNWVTCKLSRFFRKVIFIMSSWMVTCFTIDRLIAVCFPLRRAALCTEKAAMSIICIVTGAVCASQVYHLWFVTSLPDRRCNPHQPCHAPLESRILYIGITYVWSDLLLRFAIPFVVICGCNGMIICHIAHMPTRLTETKDRRASKNASLAVYTLYAVCFVFLLTMMPDSIISLLHYISFKSRKRWRYYNVLRQLEVPFHTIRLINYSMNVVLYGLTGRQFRRELQKIIYGLFGRFSNTHESYHDRTNKIERNCQSRKRDKFKNHEKENEPILENGIAGAKNGFDIPCTKHIGSYPNGHLNNMQNDTEQFKRKVPNGNHVKVKCNMTEIPKLIADLKNKNLWTAETAFHK